MTGESTAHTEWERGPDGWVFTVHLPLDPPEEMLQHELAHIVQRVRFGIDPLPHGTEFHSVIDNWSSSEIAPGYSKELST